MMKARKLIYSGYVLLGMIALQNQALADTFTVNSTVDNVLLNDVNPGDGVCADLFGGCGLRVAIQEANANPGPDRIEFSVNGTITLRAQGGLLPPITERLQIDGRTAPGYNGPSVDLEDAPPAIYIDGINIDGAANSGNGLEFIGDFTGPPSSLEAGIYAIGIVNFFIGVYINPMSVRVTVDSCYIGVREDGSIAANNDGIFIGANSSIIGRRVNFDGAIGYGNVISGNSNVGILMVSALRARISGNRIGTSPDGISARPNGTGIFGYLANDSRVGADPLGALDGLGNLVSGNTNDGIYFAGENNSIVGNRVGINRDGEPLGNGGNGISVDGDNNIIGFTNANASNEIANNLHGININGDSNRIINNRVGIPLAGQDQGNDVVGIYIESGLTNTISGNRVNFSGVDGISLSSGSAESIVSDNIIGVDFAVSGASGNGRHGIFSHSDDNEIIDNLIGFSGSAGILLNRAERNEISGNAIGVDINNLIPNAFAVGNGTHGIDIAIIGNTQNRIIANDIAYNTEDGINFEGSVVGFSDHQNSMLRNRIWGNQSLGIDLNADGQTLNDPDDADGGTNNSQNFPVILSQFYNDAVSPAQLMIEWLVDSDPANATYPITAEFYIADSLASGQGQIYLGSDQTFAQNQLTTSVLTMPSGPISGILVATATDNADSANGNTSEFGPPMQFTDNFLFDDSFEDG